MKAEAFWKGLGKSLATVAKVAGRAALWTSQHPEVLAIVQGVAPLSPNAARAVGIGVQVAGAVSSARENR